MNCEMLIYLIIGYAIGGIAYYLMPLRWHDAKDRWLDRQLDRLTRWKGRS